MRCFQVGESIGSIWEHIANNKNPNTKTQMRNEKKVCFGCFSLLSPNGEKKPKLLFSLNLNKIAPFSPLKTKQTHTKVPQFTIVVLG
jgi:hypothetical protein